MRARTDGGPPRHPVRLAVRCRADGGALDLTATAIGAGGMTVDGPAPPLGVELAWEVRLPGRDAPLALPGTARADGGAFDVAFSDSAETVRTFFRAALVEAFPGTIQAARLRVDERRAETREGGGRGHPLLSVVVPVFDEGENVEHFHRELGAALAALGVAHEVIYVDDGSRDDTPARLQRLAGDDTRVVTLSRNFGHQSAVLAGLQASRGAAVVTIDGDLQQPPSLIAELVGKWQEGHDVVNTIRRPDRRLGLVKRITSRLFYALFAVLSRLDVPVGAADFRLLDRNVVDILLSFRERHFFLRGLAHWIGFRSTYIEYTPAPRRAGESKFTLGKMLRLAGDGFFSFSAFPLRLVFYMGLSSLVITFFVFLYVTYAQVMHLQVPGWSSLLIILSFFSGLQLVGLGVVAEYVGRIFTEAKMRPRFLSRTPVEPEDVVFRALAELTAGARP